MSDPARAMGGAPDFLFPSLAVLLFTTLVACGDGTAIGAGEGTLPQATILVGNERVGVEVATTPETRRRGLMFRESLPADRGMLFLFPEERVLHFWMRNTSIPLSIAFAEAGGKIVRIAELEPHSERRVSSRAPAQYALEMNRGWFARHGVLPGDSIRRIPSPPAE